MNYGRMELLLTRAIEYISNNAYDENETAVALYQDLGMNNEELEELGFDCLAENLAYITGEEV